MKAAMAMEAASQAQGEVGAGLGMGMGFMMPAMFADAFKAGAQQAAAPETMTCPDCRQPVGRESRFCPACGRQILLFHRYSRCGGNLAPDANFCSGCGHPVDVKPQQKKCPHCGHENLSNSTFCNQCGERL
jgi:predicted amidophosphoribosyltransferase